MFYKNIIPFIIFIFLANCTTGSLVDNNKNKTIFNAYSNKGFALVYDENLYKQKIISKKISERSLLIFQKNLKQNTQVKITNILNKKSLIAIIGKNSKYPSFYNSVLSIRIAEELNLDTNQNILKNRYQQIFSFNLKEGERCIDGDIGSRLSKDKICR